jgi:ribosomal protein S3
MYYDEDDWMEFRAQCHELVHNQHKQLIEDWCTKCKVTTPIGYYNDYKGTLTIYTDRPGYLIGQGGQMVREFEEAFSKEFGKPYKVKFVEIRGGFVNVNKEGEV